MLSVSRVRTRSLPDLKRPASVSSCSTSLGLSPASRISTPSTCASSANSRPNSAASQGLWPVKTIKFAAEVERVSTAPAPTDSKEKFIGARPRRSSCPCLTVNGKVVAEPSKPHALAPLKVPATETASAYSAIGVDASTPRTKLGYTMEETQETKRQQKLSESTLLFGERPLTPSSILRLPRMQKRHYAKLDALRQHDLPSRQGSKSYPDPKPRSLSKSQLYQLSTPVLPSKVQVKDPRHRSTFLDVVAFCWADGNAHPCDQLCRAACLSNYFDLGVEGLVLKITNKGSHKTDVRTFKNAEAAFAALHFWDNAASFQDANPLQAAHLKKQYGGLAHVDWTFNSLGGIWEAMAAVLRAKFRQGSQAYDALLATGDAFLLKRSGPSERDSTWSDGLDGSGRNWLGLCLMLLRDELRLEAGLQRSSPLPTWTAFLTKTCTVDPVTGVFTKPAGAELWRSTVSGATEGLRSRLSSA